MLYRGLFSPRYCVAKKEVRVNVRVLKEGDWITLNGTKGRVYQGKLDLLPADPDNNPWYKQLMKWADIYRTLKVRTNADTPEDSIAARNFGAEGIGLCRTEHMFFGAERIKAVREMILSDTLEGRKKALAQTPAVPETGLPWHIQGNGRPSCHDQAP